MVVGIAQAFRVWRVGRGWLEKEKNPQIIEKRETGQEEGRGWRQEKNIDGPAFPLL
jgi:hypothetical protein